MTAINLTGLGMGTNAWLSVHIAMGALPPTPAGVTPCTANNSCPAAIYFGNSRNDHVISSTVESVNVYLGSGNDTFYVDSEHPRA